MFPCVREFSLILIKLKTKKHTVGKVLKSHQKVVKTDKINTTNTYIHIYTHTYTYIHIYTHIYTYIHIYTHTYTYINHSLICKSKRRNYDKNRLNNM